MMRRFMAILVLCAASRATLAAPTALTQQASSEHAKVSLSLTPAEPTSAQTLTLIITAELKPGFDLGYTPLDAVLPEGWRVIDSNDAPPRINPDNSRTITRTIRLEPFLPGEVELKSFEIPVRPTPPAGSDAAETIGTQPIRLMVRSVLEPGEKKELAAIKPVARPPYQLPTWAWFAIGGGVVALGALALVVAAMVRRARRLRIVRLTADQHATQRLADLLALDLHQHNLWREHYQGLSDVLRGYIEDRFNLAAPERTTDEFLREAKLSNALAAGDVDVLERFLTHCDMVKFAAMQPDRAQAEATLATVREFIDRTKSAELQLFVDPKSGAVRRLITAPEIAAMIERGEVRT